MRAEPVGEPAGLSRWLGQPPLRPCRRLESISGVRDFRSATRRLAVPHSGHFPFILPAFSRPASELDRTHYQIQSAAVYAVSLEDKVHHKFW